MPELLCENSTKPLAFNIALVKECSKEAVHQHFTKCLTLTDHPCYMWSLTFCPTHPIIVRGKRKNYASVSRESQNHYLRHLLSKKRFYYCETFITVFEQSKDTNVHIHMLSFFNPDNASHCLQNFKSELIECFGYSKRIDDIYRNVNYVKVDCIYKAISYMTKQPLDWVSAKDKSSIDNFNKSVIDKQYEITNYLPLASYLEEEYYEDFK